MVLNRYGDNNPYASPDTDFRSHERDEGEPENWQYAGFWERFVALFIDNLISLVVLIPVMIAVFIVVHMIADANGVEIDPDEPKGDAIITLITYVCIILVGWLYFALQESSSAQASFGKRMMGLRIVTEEGGQISFLRATGRHFGKFLSSFFLVGYLSQPFHEKRQTVHDRLAGTLVIKG